MSYTKSECPTVVYVGRIKAYKRLDHLIKAFKIVKDEVENCKLIIAGKGNQKPLKKLAFELGFNSSVEFYGEVSEDEKLRLLREAWVFVSPSMKEGWGITVIEANACGTPAVAYDVAGLHDSVQDGVTGLLVDNGNVKALAQTIIEVIEDEMLRLRLSKNALEYVKGFSWDRSSEEFLTVLELVVNER